MKKCYLLILILIIIFGFVLLSSCHFSEKIQYYSQKENYVSVTGTVSSIKYNENETVLYINFSELSPALDDTCFKIVGENANIVNSKRIVERIKPGEKIVFITAPRYFGDGYVMPIVAISIGDENLLDFEDGYKNLLDWLSQ